MRMVAVVLGGGVGQRLGAGIIKITYPQDLAIAELLVAQ
jgi:2-C-methyl-D-erythritol 4-phosphate cytidylyltransferase